MEATYKLPRKANRFPRERLLTVQDVLLRADEPYSDQSAADDQNGPQYLQREHRFVMNDDGEQHSGYWLRIAADRNSLRG